MELLLQTLDELDDLVIGLRQASLPWLAWLLHAIRLGAAMLHAAADEIGGAVDYIDRLDPLCPRVAAIQVSLLDSRLTAVGITVGAPNPAE